MSGHATKRFGRDEDGWWLVECDCGWKMEPFPDSEDAADAYGDHCFTAGLAFGQDT